MSIKIVRNAKVKSNRSIFGRIFIDLEIDCGDGTFVGHRFNDKSETFRFMESFDDFEMAKKFNGGHYCIIDGVLISFRYSDYNGFVHNDESVSILSDVLGLDRERNTNSSRLVDSPIFLGGAGESFGVRVAGLGDGGEFDANLIYNWSPFSDRISCGTEMVRLVCDNGMVSRSRILTREVRIINDWQRNLGVVSTQMRPIITDFIQNRYSDMAGERATLSDTNSALSVLGKRLSEQSTAEEIQRIMRLQSIVDVSSRSDIYKDTRGTNTATIITDLTRYDVVNILTEAFSHVESTVSNNVQIQGAINKMVSNKAKIIVNSDKVKPYQDGDHALAFFGID